MAQAVQIALFFTGATVVVFAAVGIRTWLQLQRHAKRSGQMLMESTAFGMSKLPGYALGVGPGGQVLPVISPLPEPDHSVRTIEYATETMPVLGVFPSLPPGLASWDSSDGWTTFIWLVLGLCGVALSAMCIDSIIEVMCL